MTPREQPLVGVLGNLVVRGDDGAVMSTHPQLCVVLLFLILRRNTVVGTDDLWETFWSAKGRDNVHTAVKDLRRVIEPARGRPFEILVTRPGGYQLILPDSDLDACVFEKEIDAAKGAAPQVARDHLRAALSLWRGKPFYEARGHGFADDEVRRLYSLWETAQERLFAAEIDCGNAEGIVHEVEKFYADDARVDMEPRMLLAAHAAMGQLSRATATYESFAENHEQQPSDEFTRQYHALLAHTPARRPTPHGGDSAIARYRERLREELEHSDMRWVAQPGQGAVTLPAAELFTPLFVDAGPTQVSNTVGSLSLGELVEKSDRVLLMGPSGIGKSTFLQHVGRTSASAPEGPVPVLLRCRDLVGGAWAKEARPDWRSFRSEVEAYLAREGFELTVDEIDHRAGGGRVIWLIDGLNEVPAQLERTKMARMLASAAKYWSACKWVVTSSPTISADALPAGFELATVAEWTPEDMRSFVRSLVRVSLPALRGKAADERAEAALGRILDQRDPAMRGLAGTPLFLTAMAVLDLAGRPPGESRADLLESITSWILEERVEALQSSLGNAVDVAPILCALAYHMVSARSGVMAQVGLQAAADAVRDLLPGDGPSALDVITQMAAVGALLVRRGVGDVGFSQDLFRDYFAAKHVAAKNDGPGEDGWWSDLGHRLDDPAWRDVLSFVPARLLHLGRERVDLFFERFSGSCHDAPFETRVRRVALGGQILRDLRPLGYTDASHIPPWCHAVASIRDLFRLPFDRPSLATKVEAATAYGREGDDRFGDPLALWVWFDEGLADLGAQGSDPSGLGFDRDAAPWEAPVRHVWLTTFAMRQFPITVLEYQEFVDDGGYEPTASSLWSPAGWQWKTRHGVVEPLDWSDQLAVPNAPVSGVSWFEADAYTAWLSQGFAASGERCHLPSEAQWEYAARQDVPAGQQFPWGNRMTWGDAAEANWAGCFLRHKTPVGMFPKSTTRSGVADLFGNVEEWCRDAWHVPQAGGPAVASDHKVVRGGSTIRFSRLCRPSYRSRILPGHRFHTVGFRPVLEKTPA